MEASMCFLWHSIRSRVLLFDWPHTVSSDCLSLEVGSMGFCCASLDIGGCSDLSGPLSSLKLAGLVVPYFLS
jgi:hypothetical protein